jgi:hypothetical protein
MRCGDTLHNWLRRRMPSFLPGLSNGDRQSYYHRTAWPKSGWIDQRQSLFRVKLDPVVFKVETLLAAIRAVNWSHRDWKAELDDPGGGRLATHLTLHTMVSSHEGCFGTSKPIFRLKYEFFPGGKGRDFLLTFVDIAPAVGDFGEGKSESDIHTPSQGNEEMVAPGISTTSPSSAALAVQAQVDI